MNNVGEATPLMPMLSVIVPIYNVQTYLRRCVDSIISQTYKNLEIILVDDGSTDDCGVICDDYARQDNRIRVIHQTNGGLSRARNTGIKIANGELIGFVDADDYLHPQMYEQLYEAIKHEGANMSICEINYVDDKGALISYPPPVIPQPRLIMTGYEAGCLLCQRERTTWVAASNKLYQAHLFNTINFPEGKIHEDEYVIHHLFDKCQCIAAIPNPLYYYVYQRPGSIMSRDKNRIVNEYLALWERYLFYQNKGPQYETYAAKVLQMSSDILGLALLKSNANKTLLKPLYRQTRSALIKKLDFSHAWSLFIRRHRWLYPPAQWICRRTKDVWLFTFYLWLLLDCARATKPRIFLLTAPVHGNLGDHAIIYAEKEHFAKLGKDRHLVEVPNDVWLRFSLRIAKHIDSQDIIIISGGGDIGTLWAHEDDKILDIISRFKNNEIIIFPQTCYYDQSAAAKTRIKNTRCIYGAAKNLTVMLRDRASYDFFTKHFPKVTTVLTQDIVLSVKKVPTGQDSKRRGVLLCFRTDVEKSISDKLTSEIKLLLSKHKIPWQETSTVLDKRVTIFNRNRELKKKWREFAQSQLVITDRLHGMIFAAITDTPCIAMDNISGKVSGSYEFIRDNDKILFIRNQDQLPASILKMWNKISQC